MRVESHPFDFNVDVHFPGARLFAGWEGGGAYKVEREGKAFLITDEGTMAEFLDDDDPLLRQLVKVFEFDTVTDRDAYADSTFKKFKRPAERGDSEHNETGPGVMFVLENFKRSAPPVRREHNESAPGVMFVTYENRANPRVTIHLAGCGQIAKRGGEHTRGQGEYHEHATYDDAKQYAAKTGLQMVKDCSYCKPNGQPAKGDEP